MTFSIANDDTVLVEARTGNLAEADVLRAGAAEQELIVLRTLSVDAEDADVAGMVVAAGVDTARDLELEFAKVALALRRGERLGDLLRDRDRAGVGEAAIVQAGAGDDVGDEIEIGLGQTRLGELLPEGVEIGLSDVRQNDVLRMGDAQLIEGVAARRGRPSGPSGHWRHRRGCRRRVSG